MSCKSSKHKKRGYMYPKFHEDVSDLLEEESLFFGFYRNDTDGRKPKVHNTTVMGLLICRNQVRKPGGWHSKLIAIRIWDPDVSWGQVQRWGLSPMLQILLQSQSIVSGRCLRGADRIPHQSVECGRVSMWKSVPTQPRKAKAPIIAACVGGCKYSSTQNA